MRRIRRRGLTLVDLLIAIMLFSLVAVMVYRFFLGGRRTVETTHRKVSAITQTHYPFEVLRHDLECAHWVFVPPSTEKGPDKALGGGHVLMTDRGCTAFDPKTGALSVNGRQRPAPYRDARFYAEMKDFIVKYAVSADYARQPSTGGPPVRERSTLVSKSYIQALHEEIRERSHVWEPFHIWCTRGLSIQPGFHD